MQNQNIAADQASKMLADVRRSVGVAKAGDLNPALAARYARTAAHDAHCAAARVMEYAPGTELAAVAARDAAEAVELAAYLADLAYRVSADACSGRMYDRRQEMEDRAERAADMAAAAEAAATAAA